MADEETLEVVCLQEEPWEEKTLNQLHASEIDHYLADLKAYKSRRKKKHKLQLLKRPMAIPQVILGLEDQSIREPTLRCLNNFLLEKIEEDPENYNRTAYMLYYSCSTMTILLQEVLAFFQLMKDESISVRASKRLVNVLTLFQTSLEAFEIVRAVSLPVVGILCQTREHHIILWALEIDMVEVCQTSMEAANELSKVIGMHIIESILNSD